MTDQINDAPPQYEWQTPKPKFDFGRALGNTFTGMFSNLPALGVTLVAALGLTLISTLTYTFLLLAPLTDNPANNQGFGAIYVAIFAFNYIFSILIAVWFQLVIVQMSYNSFVDQKEKIPTLLVRSFKLCVPMAFLAFLYSLVCILGFYALFIGFVFVWPGWALLGPVYLYEEKTSYFGSFGRAWGLARGYKRWIILILFIMLIISGIIWSISFSLASLTIGLNMIDPSANMGFGQSSWQTIFFTVVSSIGGFVVYGLFASAVTASYFEIKTIKGELGDMVAAVFD